MVNNVTGLIESRNDIRQSVDNKSQGGEYNDTGFLALLDGVISGSKINAINDPLKDSVSSKDENTELNKSELQNDLAGILVSQLHPELNLKNVITNKETSVDIGESADIGQDLSLNELINSDPELKQKVRNFLSTNQPLPENIEKLLGDYKGTEKYGILREILAQSQNNDTEPLPEGQTPVQKPIAIAKENLNTENYYTFEPRTRQIRSNFNPVTVENISTGLEIPEDNNMAFVAGFIAGRQSFNKTSEKPINPKQANLANDLIQDVSKEIDKLNLKPETKPAEAKVLTPNFNIMGESKESKPVSEDKHTNLNNNTEASDFIGSEDSGNEFTGNTGFGANNNNNEVFAREQIKSGNSKLNNDEFAGLIRQQRTESFKDSIKTQETKPGNPQELQKIRLSEFPATAMRMIKNAGNNTISTARLTLKPESLGTLEVRISMSGDIATMSIKADSREAMKSLESQIGTLKEKLNQEGIKTENIELSYKDDSKFQENFLQNKDGGFGRREFDESKREFIGSFRDSNTETGTEPIGNRDGNVSGNRVYIEQGSSFVQYV
jgi:flagellar hook-length control protein FliK